MRVVAGTARGTVLKTPDGMLTRPTADRVKEAVFSILHFDVQDAVVLDLFGGTGQLGIEALSRGAKRAVFVDHQAKACELIRENLRRTKFDRQGSVVRSDYMEYLKRTKEKFDLILLDPPYAEIFLENTLNCIAEIDILRDNGIIVTERPAEKALDLQLPGFVRSRDYKYGKTLVTLYRRESEGNDA
jgi:16S rRNA (guanine(966)-N(2))-methyltransferase RsmD